jgi:hypothetical protein
MLRMEPLLRITAIDAYADYIPGVDHIQIEFFDRFINQNRITDQFHGRRLRDDKSHLGVMKL